MAKWGVTEGNPLWEELYEAASMVDNVFIVNVALNRDKDIVEVFAGDMKEAHGKGCAYVKDLAMAPVTERFDMVITSNSGYPLDLNLYQSVKGMSAAYQIVKKGGAIIIAAECWDGIPDHGKYGELLMSSSGPADLLQKIRTADTVVQDMWQAQIHALICSYADVWVYSDGLSDAQIESAMCRPCSDIEETVRLLAARHGPDPSVCVLPQGPLTIPYVE
jgi:nickel-dependent lactate racemase